MHRHFMEEAIRLALESARRGNGGPFGAVIARGEAIVGRGVNRVTASRDPTAHAEIVAIRDACGRSGVFRLDDCDLYASCEPCPMCLGAIYWARIKRVFYAGTRQDAADAGFDDEFIYRQIAQPPALRAVMMQQVMREESLVVFDAWKARPDKEPY
jgi:guanine deaminase